MELKALSTIASSVVFLLLSAVTTNVFAQVDFWVPQISGMKAPLNSITYANNSFVAVGGGLTGTCAILTSTDGKAWTPRTCPDSKLDLRSVASTGTRLVAVGTEGTILVSTDGGVNWTRALKQTATLWSVTWTGKILVAVGNNGTILTSSDGSTWTGRSSGTSKQLNGVTWMGPTSVSAVGQIVAVGNDGTIVTSPDGVTWTGVTSGTGLHLRSAAWRAGSGVGELWIVGGTLNAITGSTQSVMINNCNGSLSQLCVDTNTVTTILNSVAWTGREFVAVGGNLKYSDGSILAPKNGRWWQRSLPAGINLNAVAASPSLVVAVGDSGTILARNVGPSSPIQAVNLKNLSSSKCLSLEAVGATAQECATQVIDIVPVPNTTYLKLRRSGSTLVLYSNSDGRFGTFSGQEFVDQYWEATSVDTGYRFRAVNSNKCLYSNNDGRFGVGPCGFADQVWDVRLP